MTNKMDWFINAMNNGSKANDIVVKIHDLKMKNGGSIVVPTGGGKSGIVYEDIVWRMRHACPSKKYIFVLSAPILRLEAQFVNDFFGALAGIHDLRNVPYMFFVNSSANDSDYSEVEVDNKKPIDEIDSFMNSECQFAFVASCHKSIQKFSDMSDKVKEYAEIVTYLDEAHVAITDDLDKIKRDSKNEAQRNQQEKQAIGALVKLIENGTLYALTATPDEFIRKSINVAIRNKNNYSKEQLGDDADIAEVKASKLILENKIVPVRMKTAICKGKATSAVLNSNTCLQFMKDCKEDNGRINHKILVSCHSCKDVESLAKKLCKYYTVFTIDSKNSARCYHKDGEIETMDVCEFVKNVDAYNNDCFVLHIKMMICGIDISSLTDVMFANGSKVNQGAKRTIIQTIGRAIRMLKREDGTSERGMYQPDRLKKYANVLCCIKVDETHDDTEHYLEIAHSIEHQVAMTVLEYYGQTGVSVMTRDTNKKGNQTDITKNAHTFNSDDAKDMSGLVYDMTEAIINEVKVKVKEYIDDVLKPFIDAKYKRINKKEVDGEDVVKKVKEYFNQYKGDNNEFDVTYNISAFLSDTTMQNIINEVLHDYDVNF